MTDRELNAWAYALAPGDEVAVVPRASFMGPPTIHKVGRLTATLVVLESGSRFRRDTGRDYGSPSGRRLAPASDEVKARIAAADARSKLSHEVRNINRLSDGEVFALLGALKAHRAEKAGANDDA